MNVSCQCNAVNFKTATKAPQALYHCHCLDCQHQSGSAYGTSAIFASFELPMKTQPIALWTRKTDSDRLMDCYFCKQCGTRLVHARRGVNTVSIKGGCIEGLNWVGGIHIWTKRAVVKIPDGVEQYHTEPPD